MAVLVGKNGEPRRGRVRVSREGLRQLALSIVDRTLRPGDVALVLLLTEACAWGDGSVSTSVRELAAAVRGSTGRVTQGLHRLERQGLISRPNPRRGCRASIVVSPLLSLSGQPALAYNHERVWTRLMACGDAEPPPPPSPSAIRARLADPLDAPPGQSSNTLS